MEDFFETDNNVQTITDNVYHPETVTDKESLETYNYLTRKIERMSEAFRKNINGMLTDEELNETLSY